jgi:hypothetical protein
MSEARGPSQQLNTILTCDPEERSSFGESHAPILFRIGMAVAALGVILRRSCSHYPLEGPIAERFTKNVHTYCSRRLPNVGEATDHFANSVDRRQSKLAPISFEGRIQSKAEQKENRSRKPHAAQPVYYNASGDEGSHLEFERISLKSNFAQTNYKYERLPHPGMIRLFVIHPSQEGTSTLSCHLEVTFLNSTPFFEALSYRWCEQDGGYLRCNGKRLGVKQNLKAALMRFRSTDSQRVIWADAICIDQSNEGEKKNQISLMREIYNKALRVLVWLGEDVDCKAKQAFDHITMIARPGSGIPSLEESWWRPVATFYSCEWFSRLWVFQEIAVASSADFFWGDSTIPWETVGHATTRIRTQHYRAILHHSMLSVFNAYLFWKRSMTGGSSHQHEPLLYMLQVTRQLQCSRQKDRIYALLGFLYAESHPAVFSAPNERVWSVYRKSAEQALETTNSLDLLSAVQHGSTISRLSWVPRWNICTTYTLAPLGANLERYSASQHLPPCAIQWTGRWGQFLHVSGIEFDTVIKTEEVMAESKSVKTLSTILVKVSNQLLAEAIPYPTGESFERVACFTLTAGKDEYGMMVENTFQHLANFHAFWTNKGGADWPASQSFFGIAGDADAFLLAARFACVGRRLFHTSRGYAGIGPAVSQSGDVVCILSGGAAPFILRRDLRSNTSKRRFQLVGEAYVHGIMHGEAISRHKDDEQTAVAFSII